MIDSHCHLNASYSVETVKPVLKQFVSLGGKAIVDVSTSLAELKVALELNKAYPEMIYTSVGLHPEFCDGTELTFNQLLLDFATLELELPTYENIVGIGETGLDYSHFLQFENTHKTVIEQQMELFVKHLALAKILNLPVTIHARGETYTDYKAYTEVLRIVSEEHFPRKVYFHSFGGDYEVAKKMVTDGYMIGVNGIATYANTKELSEVIEKIPLEFMLLETDAPFLVPGNMDRKLLQNPKVNEPCAVFYTAKRVAAIKKVPIETVLEITTSSSRSFFERML